MPDPSQNSFIPKRNPAKRKRQNTSRQVYIFTLASYTIMGATLLAAAGVFLYLGYVENQRDQEIENLNNEILSFEEVDMIRVQDFERRLDQASGRLNNAVSVASLFDSIESATINTVQLESLTLEREADSSLMLDVLIETDSFDSTLFQRGVYERNSVIETVVFTEVTPNASAEDEEGVQVVTTGGSESESFIAFNAALTVPIGAVPYVPPIQTIPLPPVIEFDAGTSTEEFSADDNLELEPIEDVFNEPAS